MSISRQYELLQLPRSSHYRPRSSLAEGPEHRTHMSYRRRVPEAPVWQPKDEGVFEPQRYSCKPQTNPTLDALNGLGVNCSQYKHQQAEKKA